MDAALAQFAEILKSVPDPRSKQGVSHPFSGILALVLLGLLGRNAYIAHIQRWAAIYWDVLKEPLGFKSDKPPDETTISRDLAKLSLEQFQNAFSAFFQLALDGKHGLAAAVDGKTSKQFHDQDKNPIHLLNIFVHDFNLTLAEYSVKGEKTNEFACLLRHIPEIFEKYPMLRILTGDAMFAQRPVLQALQDLGKDYLFSVKENQPTVYESVTKTFENRNEQKPDAVYKKRAA